MSSLALRRPDGRVQELARSRAGTVALLALLGALSLFLRTRIIGAGFWIDEALTVGISSHGVLDIPGVLEQDGSPPLYYLLLHGWIELFGSGEAETHALSLAFALLAIPASFWAAGSVFGRRAGWIAAALAALIPFLTAYAQETRMYTLVVLLSVLATGTFLHGVVLGRRRYLPPFGLLLALMLYTHNWSLFFAAGAFAGAVFALWEAEPRRRVEVGLAFAGAALLYAPWVPTLVYQALHTGAPWSSAPSPSGLLGGPSALFSGDGSAMALVLGAGSGLAAIVRSRPSAERRAVVATIVLAAATLLLAWLASQVSPAWANRYLAVLLGPLLVLAAVGLARAGRLGVVALVLVLLLWVTWGASGDKSNVREVAAEAAPALEPGDLVLSTHPEQVPALEYYLPPGLRYATPLGTVPDPSVMDWRDALERLRASRPETTLEPLLDRLPAGSRLLLVRPVFDDRRGWLAPWTKLVRQRTAEWRRAIEADSRFERVLRVPAVVEETFKGVRADVFVKARV